MKTLVIYYSLTDNCDFVAQEIKKIWGADLLRLVPKKDIPKEGFLRLFLGGKQVFQKETPELENFEVDLKKYDRFVIGTPVWAFSFAPALRTFFQKNTLPDKPVALFACHKGGPGKILENLKKMLEKHDCSGEIDFANALEKKEETLEKLHTWLKKLGA